MTDTAASGRTDPYGRPLGGQLERDARLIAAASGSVDLTAGATDNTTREYWYDRAREAYGQLRTFGREDDVVDFVTKAQNLELITAQNKDVVEKVDAAIGHRYHTPGVHYSVPRVAEFAAAELKRLEDAVSRVRAWADSLESDVEGNPSHYGRAIAEAARAALAGGAR